jgi:hypothetical protein
VQEVLTQYSNIIGTDKLIASGNALCDRRIVILTTELVNTNGLR